MTPLDLALHPVPGNLGAGTAKRTEGRWLARLGTALWSAFQEARQSRPERELLELIERPVALRSTRASQSPWGRHPRA